MLLVSRCVPWPLHLGDRLIVYHLARELAARGHTIDLIAVSETPISDDTPAARSHYAPCFRSITIVPEVPRTAIRLVRRAIDRRARFPDREARAWNPVLWSAVAEHRARERCDLAHVFGGIHVYEIARALDGLPALITPYESYTLYNRRKLAIASTIGRRVGFRLQVAVAAAYERFMYAAPYRLATVVSGNDAGQLRRLDPGLRVEVIANGVDPAYFQPLTPADFAALPDAFREPRAPALILTGNFEYAPNHDAARRLIRHILPRVREAFPDADAWIVGNAPPADILAHDGRGGVRVTGRVPDLRPYLARASLYVCSLAFGAGIKNKVLEAMAIGLPVVATPISLDGIAAHEGDHVVIARLDAMADAVIALLRNPDQQARLAANARALIAARYTWADAADHYERLYAELATNN